MLIFDRDYQLIDLFQAERYIHFWNLDTSPKSCKMSIVHLSGMSPSLNCADSFLTIRTIVDNVTSQRSTIQTAVSRLIIETT